MTRIPKRIQGTQTTRRFGVYADLLDLAATQRFWPGGSHFPRFTVK
jgi:hypothetical protein